MSLRGFFKYFYLVYPKVLPHFIQYLRELLFLFIKDVELANFANDNKIYAARISI